MSNFSKSYNALFKDLRMPVIMPWTEEIHNQYLGHNNDYTSYVKRIQRIDVDNASEETRLERVINLCVEGHFATAANDLGLIDRSGWEEERQVAYFRLEGTLRQQLGATHAAINSYRNAMRIVNASKSKQKWRWVDKAIRFDLLNLHEESRFEDLEELEFDHKMAVNVNAWYSNPAVDATAANSHEEISKETFRNFFRAEHSVHWSSGFPRELAWFNASLALAYLSGDFRSAKEVRLEFARSQTVNAVRNADVPRLELIVDELVRAHATKDLKLFLPVTIHLVQAHLDLNNLVSTLRPLENEGNAAQNVFDTALVLIEFSSQYLGQQTKESLRDELFNEAIRFLMGDKRYFVRPTNRVEDDFIRALSSVGELTSNQVSTLVDALKQKPPVQPWTFWRLVYEHDWKIEDRAAASKAIEIIKNTDIESGKIASSGEALLTFARVLRSISASELYADLDDDIYTWALTKPKFQTKGLIWFFLDRYHIEAKEHVARTIEEIVGDTANELQNATENGSVSINAFYPIAFLDSAYSTYSDTFSEHTKLVHMTKLIEASRNEHAYVGLKAAVFDSLANAIKTIEDKTVILNSLNQRIASEERMRDLQDSVFGHWKEKQVARLFLLKLKIESGYTPINDDLTLIINASLSPSNEAVRTSLELMYECIKRDVQIPVFSTLIVTLLKHDSYSVRAQAVKSVLASGLISKFDLGVIAFEDVLRLMGSGHPIVMQTAMAESKKHKESVPSSLHGRIVAQATLNTASSHSGVRFWAYRLLESFADDPTLTENA